MKGSSDGVWNGNRYFDSQPGRGIFVPIAHLRPDTRFGGGNDNIVKPPNRKSDSYLRLHCSLYFSLHYLTAI